MFIDKDTNKVELVKIIRYLISFIVIDGKDYIKDELKEDYIKQYLLILSKSMNGVSNYVNINTLYRTIEKDVLLHLKNEQTKKTS